MNKLIPLLAFSVLLLVPVGAQNAFAIILVDFDFTGEPGDQVSTDAVFVDGDLQGPVTISRGPGISPFLKINSINSEGWTTSSEPFPDGEDDYYTFTITPDPGLQVTITEIFIDQQATAAGPFAMEVRESTTGFALTLPFSNISPPDTITIPFSFGSTDPIEIRIYGYAAGGESGRYFIDDLIISGTVELPDADGDGVPDVSDICPGFDDNIDSDGDGIPDGCDNINNNNCGLNTFADNDLGQCIGITQGFDCGPKTIPSGGLCIPDIFAICAEGTTADENVFMCFAQTMGNMIGGALLDIDTTSLLVASIGTNPVITALVGITLAGVAGQAVWFVHRRKKKVV